MTYQRPITIYYEHPEWFRPLFAELERRGLVYEAIRADRLVIDPAAGFPSHYSLFVNRMSPSAWERGRGGAVFDTLHFLEHLEARGVPVINGSATYRLEISKALQIGLLERLGLPVPRTRVVYRAEQLRTAAEGLVFPLLVKPNMGGNGAGIERFDTAAELDRAVARGTVTAGPDGVLLLQEYHRPRGRGIVRVETLDGRFLYAIRVHHGDSDGFSICPADVCSLDRKPQEQWDHAGNGAYATAYEPPAEVIAEVESIARAAGLDVGGVEYLESERDGKRYYYDVNALSNFVADPMTVLGFDPTPRFVDALTSRLTLEVAA